ncbi:MAG: TlpA family protein disulfide reductase [Candidatus Thermoplasmatota archaeon]|nr:TlpA family protein disulfide reductase [Candidatus Thermoplasmatota archaeon]
MADFKRCPRCGASVRIENIDRHVARAHPGKKVDFDLSEEEKDEISTRKRRRPPLHGRERLLYPSLAIVIVVVVVVLALLYYSPSHKPQPNVAPDFTLPSSDGGTVRLSDFRGQVVFLDFMDTDCSVCQRETGDVLVPLHATYGNRVVFISVDIRFIGDSDTMGDILSFKAFYGATWTYVLDDGTVALKYDITATPTTYVLNEDMSVQGIFRGLTPYGTLSSSLDAALGG